MNKINWQDIKDKVFTKRGNVELEKIKVGDEVLGKNGAGEYEFYIVTEVDYFQKKDSRNWVIVNENTKFAWHQSVYINGKVRHARELQVGHTLETIDGGKLKVETVRKIKDFTPKIKLKVDAKRSWIDKLLGRKRHSAHTYYINNILVHNASRYWVGGGSSVNWNATGNTNWGSASNTQDNASVPGSSDDVFFDGVGTGASNSTLSASITINNLDFTGYANILTHSASVNLTLNGNLKMVAGMTYTKSSTTTSAVIFAATATGKTITLGGKILGNTTFNGAGGGWTLQDTFEATTASTLTLTNGTLDTNGQTVTLGKFTTAAGTKTLTLGASTVNVNGSAITWQLSMTNTTFNSGTSSIIVASGCTQVSLGGSSANYYNMTISPNTFQGTLMFQDGNFNNLTISGGASKTAILNVQSNTTTTGTLTLTGNSLTNRLFIRSNVLNTAYTFTAAAVSISNVDFQGITGAGTASPFTGTSLGDALGNSGITFTSAVTRYWVGNGGNWSDTAHWSTSTGGASGASVPLCHDTVNIDANSITSASQTITADMPRLGAGISFSGVANSPVLAFGTNVSVYGALTLVSGMTTSGNQTLIFENRSISVNFDPAGITLTCSISLNAYGGTVTLQNNLVSTSTSTSSMSAGTLNANNYNVTLGGLNGNSGSSSNARSITMGSGTWEITNASSCWAMGTCTVTANTSTLKFTNSSATALTCGGGGQTYNIIWFARGASTASITLSGSNTISEFKDTGTAAHSLLFTAGTTQTITTWTVTGTAGNVVTINSTTTATHALVKSGVGLMSSDYLDIQHSVATPANRWFAGVNSTNNQGVATAGSGWVFTAPPRPYNQSYMIG